MLFISYQRKIYQQLPVQKCHNLQTLNMYKIREIGWVIVQHAKEK